MAKKGKKLLNEDYWKNKFLCDFDEIEARDGAYVYMRQKFLRGGEADLPAIPASLRKTVDPYARKMVKVAKVAEEKKADDTVSEASASTQCSIFEEMKKGIDYKETKKVMKAMEPKDF